MDREQCIEKLLSMGAEDLSREEYPNNNRKRYFKLKIGKVTPITFRFDYVEYKEAFVYSRRKNINLLMTFDEISVFLDKLKPKILVV